MNVRINLRRQELDDQRGSSIKKSTREDRSLDLDTAGLPAPSKVRMKLFTLDDRLIVRSIGKLSKKDRQAVDASLQKLLSPVLRSL